MFIWRQNILFVKISFSTKQKVQQRKAEEEQALEDKITDETRQATKNDENDRFQRKVCHPLAKNVLSI